MNGFSGLSYGRIEEIAEQLSSKARSMEEILNSVSTELNKVGNDETWGGTAASVAYGEFNELMKKFPEFSAAVEDCSVYLKKVVSTYKSVDTSLTGQSN